MMTLGWQCDFGSQSHEQDAVNIIFGKTRKTFGLLEKNVKFFYNLLRKLKKSMSSVMSTNLRAGSMLTRLPLS